MTSVEFEKTKSFSLASYRMQSYRRVTTVLVVILIPFIANTFYQQRHLIGIFASITALVLLANILSLYKRKKFIIEPGIVTLTMIPGVIAVVYQMNLVGILWSYPVLVMLFFIHERKLALIFGSLLIVSILPLVYNELGPEIAIRILVTMSMIAIFANIFLKFLEQQQDYLNLMVITDPLTGAYNRRYFDERLKLAHGLRNRDVEVSMIMLDIDHFKLINDEFGHKSGDRVLKLFVELISTRIRETDALFRIGGEEFAILVGNAKIDIAENLAEELRRLIENSKFIDNKSVTCSMGIAALNKDETTDSWIRRADNALYKAKDKGRNRIELAQI